MSAVMSPSPHVTKILHQMDQVGLEARHLAALPAVSSLGCGLLPPLTSLPVTVTWRRLQAAGVLLVLLAALLVPHLAPHLVLQATDRDKCTVRLPDKLVDVFRPPVDCSMCQGMSTVDRVSHLTPDIFTQKYAYSGRPVIVTDGAKNWTATGVFGLDFFRQVYGLGGTAGDSGGKINCQFFPYKTEFGSLREALGMSDDRMKSPWYFGWSNCDPEVATILRRHYTRPYFLPTESESSKIDWIFMGTPGFGAHMHIDAVGKASWQAQIHGVKQWSIEPPPECYFSCTSGRMDVLIHPGEIIVLDTNKWFHKTLVTGEDVSIVIGSEFD